MSEKMETRDAMREMGELLDPVQEQLRRMLHEFANEHYHTCPSDNDSGPCDCFAGHLIVKARAALEAASASSPAHCRRC